MTGRNRSPTPAGAQELVGRAFRHIEHPRKRAFLRAYALGGRKGEAARAVGIHPDSIYNSAWRDDEEFQEALELAREMFGDMLEAAMVERGVHGVERVRFDRRTGEPLRDPRWCERCGYPREKHVRTPEGEPGPHPDADCSGFRPAIYVENEYSDRILEQLARSHLPRRYSDKLEIRGAIANLDVRLLPDAALARIADGEYVEAVLASILEDGRPDEVVAIRGALSASRGDGPAGASGAKGCEIVKEERPQRSDDLSEEL